MRHFSEIRLNNSVSLLFSMFCSHDQPFKKYQKELLHCNCLVFFLFFRNCERKKKCYQAHVMKLLLFLILGSVSMTIALCCKNKTIIFSKSGSGFYLFKQFRPILEKNISRNTLYTNVRLFVITHKVEEWSKLGSWRHFCVFS